MPDDLIAELRVLGRVAHPLAHLCTDAANEIDRLTMALHKIAKFAPEQFQQIARDALGQGERG